MLTHKDLIQLNKTILKGNCDKIEKFNVKGCNKCYKDNNKNCFKIQDLERKHVIQKKPKIERPKKDSSLIHILKIVFQSVGIVKAFML